MTRFLTSKQFGNFSTKGEIRHWKRKPKNASQAIQWRKSRKKTVISRAKAIMRASKP